MCKYCCENTTKAAKAASSVVTTVGEGKHLLPIEKIAFMRLIDNFRSNLELTDIHERLKALENTQ